MSDEINSKSQSIAYHMEIVNLYVIPLFCLSLFVFVWGFFCENKTFSDAKIIMVRRVFFK